jgi:hypothetical protein
MRQAQHQGRIHFGQATESIGGFRTVSIGVAAEGWSASVFAEIQTMQVKSE